MFLIIALIFAIVEFKGLTQVGPGDENVYFYMAKSVSQGQLPYRDFFYAHPPLHIFVLAALIKIFGVDFFILKSASLLFILAAAFFIFKTSAELFQSRINEKNAVAIPVIAVALFLFSFTILFTATFSVGIELSVMLVMISFYLIFIRKYFIGGFFAGLAGLARFYAIVPLFAIFIFILVKKMQENKIKDFLIVILGFFAVFGTVFIVLTSLYGHNFTDPVIKYHFLKPKLPGQRMLVYESMIRENWIIVVSSLLFLFAENKKNLQLFLFTILVYLVFLLSLNVPAEFYFALALPFLAIVGAYSIVNFIAQINIKKLRYFIISLVILIFLWNTAADVNFLEQYGFSEFKPLYEMAAKVSSTSQDSYIFGDPSIAPLLALKSNRKIALNYIDSNEMTFTSGLTNFYIFADKLDGVSLSYIIFRNNYGLHQIEQFRQYAQSRCKFEQEYPDNVEGSFLMYKCK